MVLNEEGSDRAALVGTWRAGRVNPPQTGPGPCTEAESLGNKQEEAAVLTEAKSGTERSPHPAWGQGLHAPGPRHPGKQKRQPEERLPGQGNGTATG